MEQITALAAGGQRTLSAQESRRAVAAAGVGNALEFYDFVTFTFFAIQIGRTFFPTHDPYVSLMASFATFGAGFLARPLGAWVLGRVADRRGRKPVLMLSMVLMGLGTALLVLTPGYARIGAAAPAIAVFARLIQGFALGGEVGAASSYMIEAADAQRRGYAISWQQAGQSISGLSGAAIGLLVSLTMNAQQLETFGWRIALGVGVVIVPYALILRRAISETHGVATAPVIEPPADSSFARTVTIGLILMGMGTTATYAFSYQASYAQSKLHLSPSVALGGQVAGYCVGIVASLYGGMLSDRIGRKPLIIATRIGYGMMIVPILAWQLAMPTPLVLIVSTALLAIVSTGGTGVIYAAIAESLPQRARATSFALIYSVPVMILGGTTQLLLEWLIHVTGNPLAVGWYLVGITIIATIASCFLTESAPARRKPAG